MYMCPAGCGALRLSEWPLITAVWHLIPQGRLTSERHCIPQKYPHLPASSSKTPRVMSEQVQWVLLGSSPARVCRPCLPAPRTGRPSR